MGPVSPPLKTMQVIHQVINASEQVLSPAETTVTVAAAQATSLQNSPDTHYTPMIQSITALYVRPPC